MKLVAYRLSHSPEIPLVPADRWPGWVRGMPLARRCLPMSIASSSGWLALNPSRVVATWDGAPEPAGLVVENDVFTNTATSIVGHGILSWQLGYAFKVPPGWSLHVRGPANVVKDGVAPLEGIYEADTAVAPAAMSWAMTRPGQVVFEAGEPIAMLAPVVRGQIEMVEPETRDLADDQDMLDRYGDWQCARQAGDRKAYARDAELKRVNLRPFVEA